MRGVGRVRRSRRPSPRALGVFAAILLPAESVFAGPGADDCAAATPIAGTGVFAFDNTLAGAGGPVHSPECDTGGEAGFGQGVWFCWTSDCDGVATVDTCGQTTVDTKIAVYEGCACAGFIGDEIICNDDSCGLQSTVAFTSVAGESYLIRIGTWPQAPGGTGTFTLQCFAGAALPCASGVGCQLPDQGGHGVEDLIAVVSDINPSEGHTAAEAFTVDANGAVTSACWWGAYVDFTLPGDCAPGADDFTITYYDDDAGGLVPGSVRAGPFPVAAARAETGNVLMTEFGPIAEWQFEAAHPPVAVTAGECLWIEIVDDTAGTCVWAWTTTAPGDGRCATRDLGSDSSGMLYTSRDFDLSFCVDLPIAADGCGVVGPPPNDDCENAEPISGAGVFPFVDFAATTDGPPHAACPGGGEIASDVWYCWEAPCSGEIVLTTCAATGVDTRIAVYDGCACPVGDMDLITCSDDDCGLQTSVEFTAMEGASYLIRIGTAPGLPGGPGAFRIYCPVVDFDPPQEFEADGEPNTVVLGELDGPAARADGPAPALDAAVVIPNPDPRQPGAVQIFLNLGTDVGGWLGFDPQHPTIPVGVDPTAITAGLFNTDPFLDLAVTNAGDDTVSILFNSALGDGTFVPAGVVTGLDDPSAIVASDFVGMDGFVDLAVANRATDTVVILVNDGLGGFAPQEGPGIPVGNGPVALDPIDIDNDKDVDLVSANRDAASVTVIVNNGDGTFDSSLGLSAGTDPSDVTAADLDGNGLADLAVTNRSDGTVSVLLNRGPAGGAGVLPDFDPQVTLPVGGDPLSIVAEDFAGDGDPDLAVVATAPGIGVAVQVLDNLLDTGSGLGFAAPIGFAVLADPKWVAGGDLDGDGIADLVTANADDGPTGGSVTALISAPITAAINPCPADIDGSGEVDFGDLLVMLGTWGPCPAMGDCPADLDGSSVVGFADLLILLATWGSCP